MQVMLYGLEAIQHYSFLPVAVNKAWNVLRWYE